MTRRKRRTLTGDRQDPSAKRTKTEQSETKEEKKVITGSEPMTRQRKKVLLCSFGFFLTKRQIA